MKVIEVLEEIHQGGFGVIHKVKLTDGQIVARKTFNPFMVGKIDSATTKKLISRFSREVKIQERLPKDLFIPIIYSHLVGDAPWFLMPLAENTYDKEIIKARKKGEIPEGLADILNSLEHLHSLGYVHRDLKPGNVLFHEDRWKLADLGLITSDSTLTSSFQTSDNFFAGSQPYMAPEQMTHFSSVTHHADIYSFGAILHDIFNGAKRVPFKKQSAKGEIGTIIEKCTDEKVIRRFKDVRSLRDVLLSQLAKKVVASPVSAATKQWIDKIKTNQDWTIDELDSFVIYTDTNEEHKETIFMSFTLDLIVRLLDVDNGLWKQLMLMYFDWIQTKSFDFDYCDVIIVHIFKAYNLTDDLEIKSRAAITAAELGASHNRWYVMNHVVKMCSTTISDQLADRISIELHVEGDNAKHNFEICAKRIRLSIAHYHPSIVAAIA